MTGFPALVPVFRAADLRVVEQAAREQPLMERAGLAAAEVARTMAGERGGAVLVLAGPGNNGGDAFVVARWLRHWFFETTVVFRGDASKLPTDAAAAHRAFVAAGGATVADFKADWRGTLVVDGLFGIGLARPLAADYATLVDRANASGVPILALDVPSGVDADTGTTRGSAIRASATATFIALKPGLLTGDGIDCSGTISVHGLDLDPEAATPARGHRLDWPSLGAALPGVLRRRSRNVHKGTFGTLGIVGGANGMVGAPLLAGRAALHAGAGKVWVGFATAEFPAADWGQPELMLRTADAVIDAGADALVCGPGLGSSDAAATLVARAAANPAPLVLDADALNLIATRPELATAVAARKAPTIATPHPAEAARLLARSVSDVQADRLARRAGARRRSSTRPSCLKARAASSRIRTARGTSTRAATRALATAGTGDVLAGLAGAFLAQGIDARTSLRLAVCLHGAAADACVADGRGPLGLTATELAPAARALLNEAAR